jgi:hypothetical protein
MNPSSVAVSLLSNLQDSGHEETLQKLVNSKLSDEQIKQEACQLIESRGGVDKITSQEVISRVTNQVLAKMDPVTKKELLKSIQKSVQFELTR